MKRKNTPKIFREKKTKSKAERKAAKERNKASKKEAAVYVKGILRGKGKGYAFLETEGSPEDYFVPPKFLGGAFNGDYVIAELTEERGEKIAKVTDIISQNVKYIVGTLVRLKQGCYSEYSVIPDDTKLCEKVLVRDFDVKMPPEGYKVVCKPVIRNGGNILCDVIEVLGDPNKKDLTVISVCRTHGLDDEFPPEVEAVARCVEFEPREEDMAGREDFRGDTVVTIDGDDTKDFDDAISVVKNDSGYILSVHIADVSHYVREGSVIDREAFRRGTSVYLPGMVVPMLPRELSNGICSLNPGVNRLTLSCIIYYNLNGEVIKSRIVKGLIKTVRRMTYHEVAEIMEGNEEVRAALSGVTPMIDVASELAGKLKQKRINRGSIEFDDPEAALILDGSGRCTGVEMASRGASYDLIEDFMLAANEEVAKTFDHMKLPFVYRVHEEPSHEKTEEFSEFLENFGLGLSGKTPGDYAALLKSIKGRKEERIINKMGLRSMSKAKYFNKDTGHFGLALKAYCHFTSPIRRYPDLFIHRIISIYLEKGKEETMRLADTAAEAAQQSSMREQVALSAERKATDMKEAEYMAGQIGKEFTGMVSSIIERGFFVQLDNTIEGFVRVEGKGNKTDADNYSAVMDGKKYTLGSELKVVCKNVSGGKIDFAVV